WPRRAQAHLMSRSTNGVHSGMSHPELRKPCDWQPRGSPVDDTGAMSTPHENAQRLAHESLAEGDSTGWFERLYAAAEAGETAVPWSRDEPNPLIVDWATKRWSSGENSGSALVVGCGYGSDAE